MEEKTSRKINVILVASKGCHNCAEVKEILKEISPDFPELDVKETEVTTPEGRELVLKYGILSSPGVIINDELFSMGGATKNELVKKFEELKKSNSQ
ncbi:MAG: hypothetical protein A3H02_01535 [Candidatus Niyogibacteria bacterium RIFCSPLOWO2_12_FULL_41_13]|uniref:Thioredoxin-like fold domain-containing protein n=1 Tax=Candidatus Niyogibacteria bacterium RIFCSPLOWO2_12_FULL_41_13 TaxID=1801726 RepID=A0A1G2F4H8_9BACT|nr:MAG: hypothetical protein A3H02_01535 [Candidatus Niyogibacteria bacterium RIFCSPLOWO2_12_FULL_41_13]